MRQANRGYTLLEVLVVLVIIGIVAGAALLTISRNDNKELQTFTKELVQTLTLAEEQALLQPATLGMVVTAKSFGFYEQHHDNAASIWQALVDPELGIHKIPAGIQISLKIAEKTLPLDDPELGQKKKLNKPPAVLVSTNGGFTPFRLLIGQKDKKPRYEIIASADGSVVSRGYQG